MHRAPPVTLSIARSIWRIRLIGGLVFAVLLSTATFVAQYRLDLPMLLLTLVVTLAAISTAVYGWWNTPESCLSWDGQTWHWSGFGESSACLIAVRQDWGRVLVLSLRSRTCQGAKIWLDAVVDPMAWRATRRAIVCAPTGWADGTDLAPTATLEP